MYLRELTIENIQSYEQETITFDPGEILIYGDNGAGKSTIFRSVFGALFPESGKHEIGTEFNLGDFVRRDAEQGRIKLVLEVGGEDYTIEWEINADGTTKTCELTSDALAEPVSGVRNVEETVSEDLLGMDASSFISSVYVQQGDIARLVYADQDKRKEILDGLLGLSRVDDLIDRAVTARREAKEKRDDAEGRLAEVRDQLNALPEKDTLEDEIATLSGEIDDKTEEIAEYEDDIEEIDDQLKDWEEKLETVDELEEERADLEEELAETRDEYESLGEDLDEAKEAKRQAEQQQADARDRIEELDGEVEAHDLSTEDAAASSLEDIESTLNDLQEDKAGLQADRRNAKGEVRRLEDERSERETDVEDEQEEYARIEDELEAKQEEEESLETELADAEDAADAAEEAVRERAANLPVPEDGELEALRDSEIPAARDELADERERLGNEIGRLQTKEEQLDDLDESGECPVCGEIHEDGRTADGRTVDEALDDTQAEIKALRDERATFSDQRDALADLREEITEAINKRETAADTEDELESVRDEIDRLEDELADQKADLDAAKADLEATDEELEDARETVESLEEKIEEIEAEIAEQKETKEQVSDACDAYEEISEFEDDIERHEESIDHAREMRRRLLEEIDDLEDEIEEIDEKLAEIDIEELREQIEEYQGYREAAVEEKEQAEAEREELRNARSDKRAKLDAVETQEERVETLSEQKEWGDQIVEDINTIIAAYEDAKSQLRKENVELLNAYANEVFDDLYQNQSYAGININQEYTIELITSDGARMKPAVTSGGETTVVNLALRAGVYRLVAKRDSSGGTKLPPFILDEPTSFLDDDHVDELHSVIQSISEWDVPQILVVSHNDQLIENADLALHVTKDPAEDASNVAPAHGDVAAAPALGDDD